MKNFYDDYFEEQEDELFDEDKISDFEDEETYPTMEEYNRIHKQKYNY